MSVSRIGDAIFECIVTSAEKLNLAHRYNKGRQKRGAVVAILSLISWRMTDTALMIVSHLMTDGSF